MRAWWVSLVAVFLVGCGARSELDVPSPTVDASEEIHEAGPDAIVDAGLDVVEEPIPFVAVCHVPDAAAPAPDDLCTTPIAIGQILQPAGCVNYYAVSSGETGELEYACDGGTSWAAVTFQGQTFPGAIQNNFVDVCIGTTFNFQDGANCGFSKSIWSTAQRIFGDYTTGALTYTYADEMIEGHSCWVPCYAWAPVSVQ
jgi:hypothetical protein